MNFPQDLLGSLANQSRPPAIDRVIRHWRVFISSEVLGSLFLLLCTIIAMIWANSPVAESYFGLLEMPLSVSLGDLHFSLTLHQWLNEGLMMAFFFLIGLEVKEQILVGELSTVRQALLPVGAALGGMLVPATIYMLLNVAGLGSSGWGVPMSTDIAFALGILALLGRRVPLSLKIFLATLAIADDIGAILVITLFYTGHLNITGLLIAVLFWLILYLLGRWGIYNPLVFFTLSILIWLGFFASGIHATIAGVVIAMAIPARPLREPIHVLEQIRARLDPDRMTGHDVLRHHDQRQAVSELSNAMMDMTPPLVQLEKSLRPWVMFMLMPLFALANAGVSLSEGGASLRETFTHPVGLGVFLGLFVGKPLGISLFTWLAVRLRLADLPRGVTWRHIRGASVLAGIGFTMSLFVTQLAFSNQHALAQEAKIGVLAASAVAGVVGLLILRHARTDELSPGVGLQADKHYAST